MIWWAVVGVGASTALVLWIYDKMLRPSGEPEPANKAAA
jgi:hypothetical protein